MSRRETAYLFALLAVFLKSMGGVLATEITTTPRCLELKAVILFFRLFAEAMLAFPFQNYHAKGAPKSQPWNISRRDFT